ncbi:MAG TPA: methylenetetrahydrofolate reductase C-terminal domain-containing protein [Alphaproteobacteria bacterium]|nr:methylenetetrahydrofolate reductase C-terminal domain-containing protein [Alphaproteobacteria bacterium]
MYALRLWSTRHARGLETLYRVFERIIVALDPLWRRIGYGQLERPVAAAERTVKGLLFDCQMCGQCILSSTGMSCPMNCPKNLRNGPCGGVRADGCCEVVPNMRCVWVEAWEGSRRMRVGSDAIRVVQPAIDRRLIGASSWLRVAREKAGGPGDLR